jgi:pimeloyl-ACP methyl ester carboxylesterase
MAGTLKHAMRRPGTYLGHLRELAGAGACVALYPLGFVRDHLAPHRLAPPRSATVDTPVILIHGYGHNRSAWTFLGRELGRAGFRTLETYNYNPLARDIPDLAHDLAGRVDSLLRETGAPHVHLVGHSLGGLVARYYVHLLGGDETVGTAVTIATPHEGTNAAWVAPGRTAEQLRPGSSIVARLRDAARPSPVRWISYYSNLDLFVQPGWSARLDHPALQATNILVKDLGHLSLLVSPRLTGSVTAQLAAAEGIAGFGAPVRALPTVRDDEETHPVFGATLP